MKFTSRSLSEKLVALGCKADSYFYYDCDNVQLEDCRECSRFCNKSVEEHTTIFTIADFVDTTEQARENCKKIYPGIFRILIECPDKKPGCLVAHSQEVWVFEEHRHNMIDSADWCAYLEQHLAEKK